jgi:hypothetical protein
MVNSVRSDCNLKISSNEQGLLERCFSEAPAVNVGDTKEIRPKVNKGGTFKLPCIDRKPRQFVKRAGPPRKIVTWKAQDGAEIKIGCFKKSFPNTKEAFFTKPKQHSRLIAW